MRVLVSDTSVLIDLERGQLLAHAFQLPYEFVVPDLLYKRELQNSNGEQLQQLGLRISELDKNGLRKALEFRNQEPALSLPDSFALSLAHKHNWLLLTGDRALRKLAVQESVKCHGVLWVIDQMQQLGVVSSQVLQESLTRISHHPRCRLPRTEIKKRIEAYSTGVGAA